MKTYQLFSDEIDNLGQAVRQMQKRLDELTEKEPLAANTCGIVFCDFDIDVSDLAGRLTRMFRFPVVGCSGGALLSGNEGYSEFSIVMIVMSADDCEFGIGMSERINSGEDLETLSGSYKSLREGMSSEPKVLMLLTPWSYTVLIDEIVAKLDEVTGGIPIFGGCAGDDLSLSRISLFCNGEVTTDKYVFLAIGGNVRPITYAERSTGRRTDFKYNITEVNGSTLYTLDDKPLNERLADAGFISNQTNVLRAYIATPFYTYLKMPDGDEVEVLRYLFAVNRREGYGSFLGSFTAGSVIGMAYTTKETIADSVQRAFDVVLKKMKAEEDYSYSAILCVSCMGRYSMLVSDKTAEARGYMGRIPDGISLAGFYSSGEYCPSKGIKNGTMHNVAHTGTFAILAL